MGITPSAQHSVMIRVELDAGRPDLVGRLATAIGEVGGDIVALDTVEESRAVVLRELIVNASTEEHAKEVLDAAEGVEGARIVETFDRTFRLHEGGKIEMDPRVELDTLQDLGTAGAQGAARVAQAIARNPDLAFELTMKRNMVAVITDGTAVLGLGDIGAIAGMPVMEGKSMLFKGFADVDSYPICLDTHDPDELIETITAIAPAFGGINLEDIAAPVCFAVEDRLKETLDIPVFHDDQHGTAIVTLAALINACKLTGHRMEDLKVVVNGIGASGVACSKILMDVGVRNIIGCDTRGAIYKGRTENMNFMKEWYAENTNPEGLEGTLGDVIEDATLFLGLSGPGTLPLEFLKRMGEDAIVFAMANPVPEIMPEEAAPYVAVMATGRSDYPNQINNVLAFPGVFRGALDCRARQITEGMKVAAGEAIAEVVSDDELEPDYIIPSVFNEAVAPAVAKKVVEVALAEGVARHAPAHG